MEAWRLSNMMAAQIQIDSDLSQVGDEELWKMRRERLAKGAKAVHPERVRIRNDALRAYAPLDRHYELKLNEQVYLAEVIPNLSRAAAKGIIEARERGYFDTPAGQKMWRQSLSRLWHRIVASDQKRATFAERLAALRE